jgi:preprotein translocase subunit SecA
MAGRGTDIKLGKGVKEAGGLAIIGTERHESRRVDRQLRGRAGRQGDPGSSQFFVSLEDNLMRLFGSDKISNIMDRLGLKEGDVIQHSMISKSIERAQRKVEENNFGIRKRLLEYDDVMNQQREVIYTKRRNALYGDRLAIDIANQFVDVTDEVVFNAQEARDYESFLMESISVLGVDASDHDEKDFFSQKAENLSEELYTKAWENYKLKSEVLYKSAYPIIKNVYETQSRKYENIALPISDGNKTLRVLAPLEKSYKTKGKELILSIEKGISLGIIDNAWKEHLRELDDLRQSVQGATYEQKDPLLIYKFESFELFQQMLKRINKEVVSFLVKGNLPLESEDDVKEGHRQKSDLSKIKTGRQGGETDAQRQAMQQSTSQAKSNAPVRVEKKVGRNDPCPCGSGKKYKHCHGKEA